jgi:hypothetical protein
MNYLKNKKSQSQENKLATNFQRKTKSPQQLKNPAGGDKKTTMKS